MEIGQLRQELTELLNKIVAHSDYYSEGKPLSSLEVDIILNKINKMQERLSVLKYQLRQQEKKDRAARKMESKELQNPNGKEEISHEREEGQQPSDFQEVITEVAPPDVPTLGDQLQQQPIENLMEAFSLNDRYLYANELFNKDMEAFNQFVKAVEHCATIESAREVMGKLEKALDLSGDNEHLQSFSTYVERRFL